MKIPKIILLGCAFPLIASAGINEEMKRFKKCYTLFVKERIASNDSLMNQVKSGAKTGTEACMEIFDKAKLDGSGEISKGNDGRHNPQGMKVLKSFTELHRSFFENPNYQFVIDEIEYSTLDVIDSNEPTYHFTYSMFKDNEDFSKIITRDHSFSGVRFSNKVNRSRSVANIGRVINFTSGSPDDSNESNTTPWFPRLVETGYLVGVKPDLEANIITGLSGRNLQVNGANVNQHHGAGIIGTQAYLIGNVGVINFGEILNFNNGGLRTYRRWSKHVMSDLLCRDLPALRTSDVVSEVVPTSALSYRQGISCMACHSSMDPMAGALRNISSTLSKQASLQQSVRFFINRPADMPPMDYPTMNGNSNYYRTPPESRLRYRSYDGTLVNMSSEGLDELGNAIATTNDLYVCAAKRYYKFLTGITVDLSDSGDMNSPKLSNGELMYRKRVIDLGLELKTHQSLRTLIKKIVESPTFLNPDRGV